ncbi:MAG: gliding motility protein GldN [Flavobacteriales bacterium]|nr:gliding motility protein GldN [Flavobacteriales bacterium]
MKKCVFSLLWIMMSAALYGQNVSVLNVNSPEEYSDSLLALKKDTSSAGILQYPYVSPADIAWSVVVYEVIDVDQKVNLPLYFPVDDKIYPLRKSLFQVLKDAVQAGQITKVYEDEYFKNKLSWAEVSSRLEMKGVDQYALDKMAEGETLTSADTITYAVTPDMVTQYRIKGMWYFDKRHSELRYRLLGIAPYGRDASGVKAGDDDMVALFWVWYPDARAVLDSYMAFNPDNAARSISYDDLFNARRFASTIYKEENMYADRAIEDYMKSNALFQLREGERIKEMIRAFEMDVWVY